MLWSAITFRSNNKDGASKPKWRRECCNNKDGASKPKWRGECCDRQLPLEVITKMERVNLSEEENVTWSAITFS